MAGERTLAFRRWKRPAASAGRTVRTPLGPIGIDAVEAIDPAAVSEAEAREAGYRDLADLQAMFDAQQGTCYRIRLHYAGPDDRPNPGDQATITPVERADLQQRLERLDAKSPTGPWTGTTLDAIAAHPGLVSTRLAELLGRERFALKADIRKLKALGLTESLDVGYRLSTRGESWRKG